MARSHTVVIELAGGLVADAWDEVSITVDMLRPGSPWTVTLWRTGRGASWTRVREVAQVWAPVTVKVDGAVQLRGQIERLRDGAGRSGAPVTLGGRDLLAAALVSDIDPRLSQRDATLEEAIERALAPLRIPVTVGANAAEVRRIQAGARPGARPSTSGRTRRRVRVDRFKPKVGERVWAFLEGLARRHSYMIFGAPVAGGMGLVIDRPAYDAPVAGSLVRGRRSCSAGARARGRRK